MATSATSGVEPRSTAKNRGDQPDVVFAFSRATWQAASRRGFFASEDRLALSLIHSDRIGRLLICNHARNGAIMLARRLTGSDRVPFPAEKRIDLVEPISLRRREPTSIAAVERAMSAYDRALSRAVRRHGLTRPDVITGNPLMAGFAELPWARSVTWYAIDDWSEHPAYSPWRNAYLEAYERVRRRGRAVAAVSQALLDRLDPMGPGIVVPNGLDPDEWTAETSPPAWFTELPGPVYSYVGALDIRIDTGWVRALALAEPSASILFVGPLAAPEHMAPLRDLPNVHFRAPVDRTALRGLIGAADVGLLPHHVTKLTSAMSPLKLLEYLAAGLPVAATDLEPVRAINSPRTVLTPAGGDFVAGARAALALGRTPEPERLEFIADNSWRSRHERVIDLALAAG
ncbi:MAG: glycosyltransferase [Solirubrobacteraceae bacterium]